LAGLLLVCGEPRVEVDLPDSGALARRQFAAVQLRAVVPSVRVSDHYPVIAANSRRGRRAQASMPSASGPPSSAADWRVKVLSPGWPDYVSVVPPVAARGSAAWLDRSRALSPDKVCPP